MRGGNAHARHLRTFSPRGAQRRRNAKTTAEAGKERAENSPRTPAGNLCRRRAWLPGKRASASEPGAGVRFECKAHTASLSPSSPPVFPNAARPSFEASSDLNSARDDSRKTSPWRIFRLRSPPTGPAQQASRANIEARSAKKVAKPGTAHPPPMPPPNHPALPSPVHAASG